MYGPVIDPTKHKFIDHSFCDVFPIGDGIVDMVATSIPSPMLISTDETYAALDPRIHDMLTEGRGLEAFESEHRLLDRCWVECARVLKPGGILSVAVADVVRTVGDFQLYPNTSRITTAMLDIGMVPLPSIICRRPSANTTKHLGSGMLPAGAYVTVEHERILLFRKGEKRVISKADRTRRAKSALFWDERNQWYSDVWDENHEQTTTIDPQLLRPILMHTMYGDVVLDPWGRRGSTSIAGILTGRHSITLEADATLLKKMLTVPTKHKTKTLLNQWHTTRMRKQLESVHSRDMLFYKYRNRPHGVPVKTTQEQDLTIYQIKSIRRDDDTVITRYQNLKNTDEHPLSLMT
ncbi:MAG: DNA methyltransferase [Bacteroidota bacterium]